MHHAASIVVARIRSVVSVAMVAGSLACSAGGGDGSPGGAASGGHASQPSPTPASGGSSLVLDAGGSSSAGGAGAAKVCTAEVREGVRLPVDMYFLLDSSGSMGERVQGGSKWQVVSQALIAFLNDPRNAETAVGVGYFPNADQGTCMVGQAGCLCIPFINVCFANVGGSCVVADYATPAVPLVLPPSVSAVLAGIQAHRVSGGTPTRPAVEGALQYLNQWADEHPARTSVLVLATDGDPTGCDSNSPGDIAALAASALAGRHAIKTFVIGVGGSLVSLNLVAQAGGTGQAFLVDAGGDVAKAFSDALEQIRDAAASCVFAIPSQNAAGMSVNPSQVNVRYTPGGASTSTLVTQTFMSNPQNCDSAGGWYYDNPQAPTRIELCESTCQALSRGTVQVEFGCDTIKQPPR
jgi:hypothetical protein